MNKKSTLYGLAAFLVIEAVVILAIPSRMPRAARGVTAGINVVAAAAVFQIGRMKK